VSAKVADTNTLIADLLAVNAQFTALCQGLTEDQLAWRPDPAKWSSTENLIHLCTTTEVFLPSVDQALAESRRKGMTDTGSFRLGWYGRLLVRYVEPPPTFRLPAPRALKPRSLASAKAGLEAFLASQAEMMRRMQDATGLNLTGLRFPSPVTGYVRMNLLEFWSVFNGHSRRHLWQASNVGRNIPVGTQAL
jgi:hypothetical protein